MKTTTEVNRHAARRARGTPSLFRKMTKAQSRQARAIAYEAALAVIG